MNIVECPNCKTELKECEAFVRAELIYDEDFDEYTLKSWGDILEFECRECGNRFEE